MKRTLNILVMVLEIKIANMYSIHREVSLDLQALNSVTRKMPALSDNVFACGDETMLKTVAIYGANASGKSSLVKAIRDSVSLVLHSHENNDSSRFPFSPFKFCCPDDPSSFCIRFLMDGVEYEYSFSTDTKRILTEELYYYPYNRKSLIFSRDERISDDKGKNYRFRNAVSRPKDVVANTSDTVLFLSRGSQMDRPILRKVYSFFLNKIVTDYNNVSDMDFLSRLADNKERMLTVLRTADSDIVDFTITDTGVITHHRNNPSMAFNLSSEESDGTRKLFRLALTMLDVIDSNKLLIVDELETSLHMLLVEYIIGAFHSAASAQLLFTTHNTGLMKSGLMRYDQIYFTMKMDDGSTDLFSLSDFRELGKNPEIDRDYLEGRFDAIPYISEFCTNA